MRDRVRGEEERNERGCGEERTRWKVNRKGKERKVMEG